MRGTLSERFWPKVQKTDGCWEWTAALHSAGYGVINRGDGTLEYAHRLSYRWLVGAIPDGLTIDHLCRNRKCVRPDHLEAVTQKTNWLRGTSPAALHAKKTHCPKGHEFAGANLYQPKRGGRQCRACRKQQTDDWCRKNRPPKRAKSEAAR